MTSIEEWERNIYKQLGRDRLSCPDKSRIISKYQTLYFEQWRVTRYPPLSYRYSTNKLQEKYFILQINSSWSIWSPSRNAFLSNAHAGDWNACRSQVPIQTAPRIDSIERPVSRNVSIQTSLDTGLLSLPITVNNRSSPLPFLPTLFFPLSFNQQTITRIFHRKKRKIKKLLLLGRFFWKQDP